MLMPFRAYDKKYLIRLAFLILVVMVVDKLSAGTAMVAVLPCALMAMSARKSVNLLFILLLLVSVQVGNSFFFPKTLISMLAIRSTLLCLSFLMAARVLGGRLDPILRPFCGIFIYLAWEAVSSVMGYMPTISFLKLALFSLIYLAYMAIANDVIQNNRVNASRVRAVVLSFGGLFLLGSVALIPFPGIGLMTWQEAEHIIELESLFKGMTSHSQSLGPITATCAIVLLADMVFAVRKLDRLYVLMLAVSPLLIFKTGSRTALGTFLGGGLTVWYLFVKARGLNVRWKRTVGQIGFFVAFFGIMAMIAIPHYRQGLMRFILKRGWSEERVRSSELTFDSITSSRQGKAEVCLYHFKQSPIFGNGFQVSEEMKYERRRHPLQYLAAPIEKGFWVFAVLEEGGVIGLVLFAGFLLVLFLKSVNRKAYVTASSLVVVTLANCGEFVFFSMTYTGGLLWAFVFAAAVLDAQRQRQQIRAAQLRGIIG